MESLFRVFFGSLVVACLLGICVGIDRIANEFEDFNANFDFTVEEQPYKEEPDLNPGDGAIVREIALMQAPIDNTEDGMHEHAILLKKLQRVQTEISRLNDRLNQQAIYIKELRMRLKEIAAKLEKATDDVPQTNEDYARVFSIIRHEHGMLQANLYTYVFNANRGRVDPPRILPRNYDFELPEQELNPFPPPVVN